MLIIGERYNVFVHEDEEVVSGEYCGVVRDSSYFVHHIFAIAAATGEYLNVGEDFCALDEKRMKYVDPTTGEIDLKYNHEQAFIDSIVQTISHSNIIISNKHFFWVGIEDIDEHDEYNNVQDDMKPIIRKLNKEINSYAFQSGKVYDI